MIEYIKTQKDIDEAIINQLFTLDELHRFSKSDSRWASNRGKRFQTRKPKKGEIYQFEFGKNYAPEMSYEHRGLVIGVKDKLLYVLPIYSYDPSKHTNVHHPTDFPNSKSDLFLLKSSEFGWIKHDSVLKLNDIRTISINRILYPHPGNIAPNTATYKCIITLVLKKYFAEFYHEFERDKAKCQALQEDNEKLTDEVNRLEHDKNRLAAEVEQLKKQIEELLNAKPEIVVQNGDHS